MLRGGSWNNNAENQRPGARNRNNTDNRNNNNGFRVASTPHSRSRRGHGRYGRTRERPGPVMMSRRPSWSARATGTGRPFTLVQSLDHRESDRCVPGTAIGSFFQVLCRQQISTGKYRWTRPTGRDGPGPGSAVVCIQPRCSCRAGTRSSWPVSTSRAAIGNGRFSTVHSWPVLGVHRGTWISTRLRTFS